MSLVAMPNAYHNVVRDVTSVHGSSHRDKVVGDLHIAKPENGIPAKDNASTESTLEFVNKDIIPGSLGSPIRVGNSEVGWFTSIEFVKLSEPAVDLKVVPDKLGRFDNDWTTWRSQHISLTASQHDNDGGDEYNRGKKESWPETDILFKFSGGDGWQGTNVDTLLCLISAKQQRYNALHLNTYPVKVQEDLLVGSLRTDNNTFTTLQGLDVRWSGLVLLSNQRSNIGFDTTGTQTNDNDGNNIARESTTISNRGGNRGTSKDHKTKHINGSEENDSTVLAEPLISNDGANDLNVEK